MSLSIEESYIKKWNDKWTNFVFKKVDKKWDYNSIIVNPNLQFDNELFDIFIKLDDLNSFEFRTQFINFERLCSYDNIPLSFIIKHSEIYWDYQKLSYHPLLTLEFVLSKPDKYWNWNILSKTLKITIDDVLNTQHLKWSYKHLSCNPNITFENLQQYPTLDWSYKDFSKNPNLTFDIVLNDLRESFDLLYNNVTSSNIGLSHALLWDKLKKSSTLKNWNFDFLSLNPKIKFSDIVKYKHFYWNWRYVSSRDDLDFTFVFDNLNLNWDWYQLSHNKNLTLEILDNNINLDWDWKMVSANSNLTFTNPKKYPKINYEYLSKNSNLTFDVVNNLDINYWNFDELSFHPNLSFNFVFGWDWYLLSRHPKLSLDIIQDYFNLNYYDRVNSKHKWEMKGLSENPNLTIDFIVKNITEDWNWQMISINDMNMSKKKYLINKVTKQYKKIVYNLPLIKDVQGVILNYLI
jgi:hypothetical protein